MDTLLISVVVFTWKRHFLLILSYFCSIQNHGDEMLRLHRKRVRGEIRSLPHIIDTEPDPRKKSSKPPSTTGGEDGRHGTTKAGDRRQRTTTGDMKNKESSAHDASKQSSNNTSLESGVRPAKVASHRGITTHSGGRRWRSKTQVEADRQRAAPVVKFVDPGGRPLPEQQESSSASTSEEDSGDQDWTLELVPFKDIIYSHLTTSFILLFLLQ